MKKYVSIFLILISGILSAQHISVYEVEGAAFNDVSSNGEYACGVYNYSFPFVWTKENGLVLLSTEFNGECWGVSNTGRVAGRMIDTSYTTPEGDPVATPGYWEPDGSWHAIGGLPGIEPFDQYLFGNATCISDDGTIIGGYGAHENWHVEAFRWTEADGFFDLKGDNEYQGTRAISLSGDGEVLGGWVSAPGIFWQPTIWNPDELLLGSFNPDFNDGDVFELNHDGSIAYGKAGGTYYSIAMYWTAATGIVNLTSVDDNYESKTRGGSDDGSIMGGEIGPWGETQGFIYTPDAGMKMFQDWLAEQGITLSPDWIISAVSDFSANGKVIAAYGNNTSNPSWSDGLIIIFDDNTPVELTSFNAKFVDKNVVLNWETASETNNYGFEVERKIGNNDWVDKAFVEGGGTTTNVSKYSFTDKLENNIEGIISYRLKQIDFDGKYQYSKVVEISTEQPEKFDLAQNFPNPFNPATTIKYSIPNESLVTIRIFNSLGELVQTLVNKNQPAGRHSVQFNGANLSSGSYIYEIQAGDFSKSKKMLLLK